MMRVILFVLSALLSSAVSAQTVTEQRTPNGVSYWHLEMQDSDRVVVAIHWPAGLSGLPAGQEATARIAIDLMLNGGTTERSADILLEDFNDLDAGSILYVQPDHIQGLIATPVENALEAAEIANEVLTKPAFGEKWFARSLDKHVRRAIAAKKGIWRNSWKLIRSATFSELAYDRFWSLSPQEKVAQIKLDDVKAWHKSAFKTGGMTIVSAGNPAFETIGKAIDRALEGFPSGNPPEIQPLERLVPPSATILLHKPEAQKSLIQIVGAYPARSEIEGYEAGLSVRILGRGAKSRLFEAIRTRLRVTYGFSARKQHFTPDHRLLVLAGEIETARLQEALDVIKGTYETFRREGVSVEETDIFRTENIDDLNEQMESPIESAKILMTSRLLNEPMQFAPGLPDMLAKTIQDDLNRFINQKYPTFDEMLKVIVTPDKNAIAGACVITKIEDWKTCL